MGRMRVPRTRRCRIPWFPYGPVVVRSGSRASRSDRGPGGWENHRPGVGRCPVVHRPHVLRREPRQDRERRVVSARRSRGRVHADVDVAARAWWRIRMTRRTSWPAAFPWQRLSRGWRSGGSGSLRSCRETRKTLLLTSTCRRSVSSRQAPRSRSRGADDPFSIGS